MAQVRNKTDRALLVPELGKTVQPDEVVTVPDDRLEAYICQTDTWGDETAAKAAKKKEGVED